MKPLGRWFLSYYSLYYNTVLYSSLPNPMKKSIQELYLAKLKHFQNYTDVPDIRARGWRLSWLVPDTELQKARNSSVQNRMGYYTRDSDNRRPNFWWYELVTNWLSNLIFILLHNCCYLYFTVDNLFKKKLTIKKNLNKQWTTRWKKPD